MDRLKNDNFQSVDNLFARRILRDMNQGLFILDLEGKILACNSLATNILDLKQNITGLSYSDLIEEFLEKNQDFHQLIIDAIYKKSQKHEQTINYTIQSGNIRRLRVCTSFLMDDENNKLGIVLLLSDMTEMETLQQERREASKLFVILVCGISVYLFIWQFLLFIGLNLSSGANTQIAIVFSLIISFLIIKYTNVSLESLKIPKENFKTIIQSSLEISAWGLGILVLGKILILYLAPSFFAKNTPFWNWAFFDWSTAVYPITVFLQEFLTRTVMQDSLRKTFSGPKAGLWAILASSLIFGVMHISHGYIFMFLAAIMLGILGFIYEKQRNIWGVSIIHYILGISANFLGFIE